MNIKSSVYESLTPRQRVIATIEAEARGDDDEVTRLQDTCPKFTYRQTDVEYSYTMARLIILSLAVESDIRGQIIGVLLSAIMFRDETLEKFLQNIANIRAAWIETIETLGIDPTSMEKFGLLQHMGILFIDPLIPEPNREAIPSIKGPMTKFINI